MQLGGGITGLIGSGGQFGGYAGAPSPSAGGGNNADMPGVLPSVTAQAQAPAPAPSTEVINAQAVQRTPANPYGFNIADFVTPYDPRNYSDYLPTPSYRA